MGIRDHMHELAHLHIAHLGKHMKQYGILAYIPVICRQHVIRALVKNSVKRQPVASLLLGHIKRHTVGAGIQIHLMEILMHVDIRHNPPAVRIMLQIVDHPVYLIKHPLFILVLYSHLIAIGFSDQAVFIRPAVPNVAVQFVNIIGLLLPDPQQFIRTAFNSGPAKGQGRELF